VLPALQRSHDVLAPTLPGHAGGPSIEAGFGDATLADAVEAAMDAAGFETAHIAGNSLGGAVALQLAARGRARSAVVLAPAGGWAKGDDSHRETLAHFSQMLELVPAAVPYVEQIVASRDGRRRATEYVAERYEHIPPELIAHQITGVAECSGARAMIDHALSRGWSLPEAIPDCPIRFVWGTRDRLLPWPSSAARFRSESWSGADWSVLDGVGHCPQLDVPEKTSELILGFTAAQ
jgi:pimeloyl-ACP methyl ester carboxylesterase